LIQNLPIQLSGALVIGTASSDSVFGASVYFDTAILGAVFRRSLDVHTEVWDSVSLQTFQSVL
jgi:hypothetical protein